MRTPLLALSNSKYNQITSFFKKAATPLKKPRKYAIFSCMQTHEHSTTTPPLATAFSMTEDAAKRINNLKIKENNPSLRFRVSVLGGGCSGFQYEFTLDGKNPAEDDKIISRNGAEVIIDDISLGIIGGSVLDYTEDLAHAGFSIKNPNATARCGCGNSFSVA